MSTGGGWGPDDIGDLTGRVAVVTGANSGIGLEAALELAAHGAHVVLACRDRSRADQAMGRILRHAKDASVEVLVVDLADLESVRAAAHRFATRHHRLDLLLNNAGVMGVPYRVTADGLELQLATNHVGHFALTGLLSEVLVTTARSRVVTVSSLGHRIGRIDFDNLQWDRHYDQWFAYGRSKLANLLFTAELERRLRSAGTTSIAVAAHPGWARSQLVVNGPGMTATGLRRKAVAAAGHLGQSAAAGARPLLYAATSPDVVGGALYGPRRLFGLFGAPAVDRPARRATDADTARRLWEVSEKLTGVRFELDPVAAGS